ncbi:unnamed protein product [Hymenolepis diminuta]|uniref:Uncharacterized protein n=1 Tax=Hymenolepis diminuta TaxID=6216 RepID=A0A564Y467_HYMDI|nr:unnamed protein product [Hymenolepis diminuta]
MVTSVFEDERIRLYINDDGDLLGSQENHLRNGKYWKIIGLIFLLIMCLLIVLMIYSIISSRDK